MLKRFLNIIVVTCIKFSVVPVQQHFVKVYIPKSKALSDVFTIPDMMHTDLFLMEEILAETKFGWFGGCAQNRQKPTSKPNKIEQKSSAAN